MLRFHSLPFRPRSDAIRASSRVPGFVPRTDARKSRRSSAATRATRIVAIVAAAVVAAVPAVTPAAAGADPWDWSLHGAVDLRAHASGHDTTRLVPEPERIGRDSRFLSATGVVGLHGWNGPVTVSAIGRPFAHTASRDGGRVRLHVDELHAEYAAGPEHFLFAGRRHIVHGRSLGVNPLDIALDPVALDRSKDATRRRSEIEGQDMLGVESLLDDGFALTGYWTPGERALMAGTFNFPAWKSDLTALIFDDDRPGAGVSFSQTLGEAALGYADIAIRRGRDRPVIGADHDPGADPGTFVTHQSDSLRWFPQSSIGTGYTFDSGATFNLEYHFDANGYSSAEWDEITGLVFENDAARRAGRLEALATGNLLRLSAKLDRFTLRRHYGFLRAHHPGLFGDDVAVELTALHGLAGHSGSMGLRLEREVGPNLLLGVESRYRYGGHFDEFVLRAARLSGSVYATIHY